ncbi:hypothetical protein H4R19_006715, partial [Coemansia spiralis]
MFNIPYLSSCNHCRDKKRKCNGERPACSLCRAHDVPCEYRRSRRFRKRLEDPASAAAGGAIAMHAILPAPDPLSPQTARPLVPLTRPPSVPAAPPVTSAYAAQMPLQSEAQALTRLLSGDMFPQTQKLPQPILQGVNIFMSPFSDARSQAIPEWISQQNPEADIISNLESIANAYPTSPLAPLQGGAALDGALFGSLASQLMT